MVNQFYEAEILTEYVIRGNTAVLKCSIPSFVADFVHVESWSSDDGTIYSVNQQGNQYGITVFCMYCLYIRGECCSTCVRRKYIFVKQLEYFSKKAF